ncbi:MAG: hypothetical protein M1834_008256 [Cirrosporium novae-zelandiae]|nr:MAG: hypothetical protein M1834_008256 [Cirrosporium novae-zelandiae]
MKSKGPGFGPQDPQGYPLVKLFELPEEAPEILKKNSIWIHDRSKIFTIDGLRRRGNIIYLVKRYMNQMLYGCQNPSCRAPTCLSYKRRVSQAPLRRYTLISARTLAFYLVSQDDPEKGLCPNRPLVPVESMPEIDLESPSLRYSDPTNPSKPSTPQHDKFSSDMNSLAQVLPQDKHGNGDVSNANIKKDTREESAVNGDIHNSVKTPKVADEPAMTQKEKDWKSFTQTLFDTAALKTVESWREKRKSSLKGRQAKSIILPASIKDPDSNSQVKTTKTTPRVESRPPSLGGLAAASGKLESTKAVKTNGLRKGRRFAIPISSSEENSSLDQPIHKPPIDPSIGNRPHHQKPVKSLQSNLTLQNSSYINHNSPSNHSYRSEGQQTISENLTPADTHVEKQKTEDTKSEKQQPNSMLRKPHTESGQLIARSLSHLSPDIAIALYKFVSSTKRQTKHDDMYMSPANQKYRNVVKFAYESMFYILSTPDALISSFGKDGKVGIDDKPNGPLGYVNLFGTFQSLNFLLRIDPSSIMFNSLWRGLEALFVPPPELSFSKTQKSKIARIHKANMQTTSTCKPSIDDASSRPYISDQHAARIIVIAFCAVAAAFPYEYNKVHISQTRAFGTVIPRKKEWVTKEYIEATDIMEDEMILRLMTRLTRAIVARLRFAELAKNEASPEFLPEPRADFMTQVLSYLKTDTQINQPNEDAFSIYFSSHTKKMLNLLSEATPKHVANILVEMLRTLLLKNWDGKADITKSSVAGGAVEVMSHLYENHQALGLPVETFQTPILSERLELVDTPIEWLAEHPDSRTTHLLSYPFLFMPYALVNYFRAVNYTSMLKAFETSFAFQRHVSQVSFMDISNLWSERRFADRLRVPSNNYLVLDVGRKNVLTDTLNQLWRREKRELMRPLKVYLGRKEGEEGVDVGGVQQEFFRIAIAQALNPDYGLFTTDSTTRMSWFQPCSLEPLYKFELLGLLVSLAVYNGLTLPITFPQALYRKLLGKQASEISHIQDGWPDLSRGLRELLRWDDGDVGDVFMRTYEFSFEIPGSTMTVDMNRVGRYDEWPIQKDHKGKGKAKTASFGTVESSDSNPRPPSNRTSDDSTQGKAPLRSALSKSPSNDSPSDNAFHFRPQRRSSLVSNGSVREYLGTGLKASEASPTEEASLVTNQNRVRYVHDYIFWLTDKSIRPQYEAFARGFYMCLDRKALSIFNPEALQSVVQGIQEIDVQGLEQTTTYEDGYSKDDRVIKDFWEVVRNFSIDDKKKLLEFVTSSDRVPVNGIRSIQFTIQRSGTDNERLPTSSTCFGRLLLPEYSSKEILKAKLQIALENSKGFGVL